MHTLMPIHVWEGQFLLISMMSLHVKSVIRAEFSHQLQITVVARHFTAWLPQSRKVWVIKERSVSIRHK